MPSLRFAISAWISMAHCAASATLGNSASMPSPAVLMMRPRFLATVGSISSSRWVMKRACVPASSASISRL